MKEGCYHPDLGAVLVSLLLTAQIPVNYFNIVEVVKKIHGG